MYAIAYDIGSTTIVGYLCDLDRKQILISETLKNPQTEYGLDILSRVSLSAEDEKQKKHLQDILFQCMEELAMKLIAEESEDKTEDTLSGMQVEGSDNSSMDISRILFVGNPVMIGFAKGRKFNLDLLKNAEIVYLPAIGGYVGADALAASYMAEMDRINRKKKDGLSHNSIMIDIGTNTEIVLLSDESYLATSAAAGPALEGGNIKFGMRGETGAIDTFKITGANGPGQDIAFHVIGNGAAEGICGSGLLSLVQLLRSSNVIDENGYLLSREEAIKKGVANKIAARIVDETSPLENEKSIRYFKLTDKVKLFQEDIRNLQLAVAAIRAGIEILMKKACLTVMDLDAIYLAGTFGNKITVSSALEVGMLPKIDQSRVILSGNLAGLGACYFLMKDDSLECAGEFRKRIEHIMLSSEKSFQENFIKYMHFPD